jgi:hypothetical protein
VWLTGRFYSNTFLLAATFAMCSLFIGGCTPVQPTTESCSLKVEHPSDTDIVRFIFAQRYPDLDTLTPQQRQGFFFSRFGAITQQSVDIDDDERKEILVTNQDAKTSNPFLSILSYSDSCWHERLYTDAFGRYCGNVKAQIAKPGEVVVDFVTCNGGTGLLITTRDRRQIQCDQESCGIVNSTTTKETKKSTLPVGQ